MPRDVQRLLVACVREHDWAVAPAEAELLTAVDQGSLVQLAELHRVSSAVLVSLGGTQMLSASARSVLGDARRAAVAYQLRAESDLRLVAQALDAVTSWLVVKGPALARGYYRRPDLRSYVDVDVLVPPAALREALAALEGAGFVLLDRNWTLLAQRLSGELHLRSPHGAVLDLHWDLFNDRSTRDSFRMSTASFFARSRPLDVGGLRVRTLDPADTVIHTSVHAARSGGDRLIWMKDLEQLVLSRDVAWDELVERCREHHAQLAVAAMLQRARMVLGVPGLPRHTLRSIAGSSLWPAVGRVVDLLSPVVGAGEDGSLARMYSRATRADVADTARELTRRAVARARRQTAHEGPDRTWDPTHPGSVVFESGGARMRDQFLTAVAQTGAKR